MNAIFNYANAPIIVTFLFMTIILILIIYIRKISESKESITKDFMDNIRLMSRSGELEEETKKDPFTYWNNLWGNNFKKAGWVKVDESNRRVGLVAFLGTLFVYLFITLLSGNIGIALVPIISGYLLIYLVCEKAIQDRKEVFDEQVPIFLSLLKSNIRAGETAEKALANAIDEMEDPIYSELKNTRALIDIGNFQSALSQLRKTTTSETLRFLCSCIELSTKVGSSLESQITIIEDVLESNRNLRRKLKSAISKNTPLLYVSATLIPFTFLFTYFFNEQSGDFWFVEPISWIAFIVSIAIYLGSVFASKYIVKKTSDF